MDYGTGYGMGYSTGYRIWLTVWAMVCAIEYGLYSMYVPVLVLPISPLYDGDTLNRNWCLIG